MEKYHPLIFGNIYHVYNRANGSERMFYSFENYNFFLRRFQHYVLPFADVFCYCLLSNHFHFIIRVKAEAEVRGYFEGLRAARGRADLQGFKNLGGLAGIRPLDLEKHMSKAFSNLFNSYAKALNKSLDRKGSLFMQNFKRKLVDDDCYLQNLVHYIHYNPSNITSGEELKNWPFSSYNSFLSKNSGFVRTREIILLFGGKKNFLRFHEAPPEDEIDLE